jgi:hypothetical protein
MAFLNRGLAHPMVTNNNEDKERRVSTYSFNQSQPTPGRLFRGYRGIYCPISPYPSSIGVKAK